MDELTPKELAVLKELNEDWKFVGFDIVTVVKLRDKGLVRGSDLYYTTTKAGRELLAAKDGIK